VLTDHPKCIHLQNYFTITNALSYPRSFIPYVLSHASTSSGDLVKCKTCGRDSSYALKGYSFPLHGDIGLLWRPNQIKSVLNEVNEEDGIGWTALHQAVAYRNINVVKELIELGCTVDATTFKGLAAIHIATMVHTCDSFNSLTYSLTHYN